MLTRRSMIKVTGILAAGVVTGQHRNLLAANGTETDAWRMPDEGEPHARTWMAFGASKAIWGRWLLPEVRRNLALIANTISQYEPVTMLVREDEHDLARGLVDDAVELVNAPLDDLWMRDTGPVFVTNRKGKRAAINFNFNGWGNKQEHENDARVADRVAELAGVPVINTDLVLEGGCIVVDGHGTGLMTESCTLNDNRNPGVSKADFESKIKPLLGLKKIVWLPGIRGRDITDGHTDFYARFTGPGSVTAGFDPDPASYDHAVTLRHLERLRIERDHEQTALKVRILEAPTEFHEECASDDFAAGYIGYYLCNGAVIMQQFGDRKADAAARDTLQKAYPDRRIEMIAIDGIAAGGGSVHCATQQEPAV